MNRSIFRLLLSLLLMVTLFSQGVATASMMGGVGMKQGRHPAHESSVSLVQDVSVQPCHGSLRMADRSLAKSGPMKHLSHSEVPSKCGSCTGCMGPALINNGMVYLSISALRVSFLAPISVYSSLPADRLERPPRFVS